MTPSPRVSVRYCMQEYCFSLAVADNSRLYGFCRWGCGSGTAQAALRALVRAAIRRELS